MDEAGKPVGECNDKSPEGHHKVFAQFSHRQTHNKHCSTMLVYTTLRATCTYSLHYFAMILGHILALIRNKPVVGAST